MTYQETEAYIRSLPQEEQMDAIFEAQESIINLSNEEATDLLLSLLDILYDDLTGKSLETYFKHKASQEAADKALSLNASYLEQRLKQRNLLYVETDPKTKANKTYGTLRERIDKMTQSSNSPIKVR